MFHRRTHRSHKAILVARFQEIFKGRKRGSGREKEGIQALLNLCRLPDENLVHEHSHRHSPNTCINPHLKGEFMGMSVMDVSEADPFPMLVKFTQRE